MRYVRRVLVVILTALILLSMSLSMAAAGDPHAGNSGHFKGSSTPCQSSESNPNCPPFGG
jgi:hypothetical protein